MIRILLTIVVPILLPFLIYGIYMIVLRRRIAAGLAPAEAARMPWLPLFFAGVVLMAAALFLVRVNTGLSPGTKIEPPRYIDGEVVPSHPVESQ